jgi:hypothetical protein
MSRGTRRGLLVAGAILLGALAALVVRVRRPGDPLTEPALKGAEDLWRSKGPAAYELEVEVRGSQRAVHVIRVRGGKVVGMTTGGSAVPPDVWRYWSVEGMFEFLREELLNLQRTRESYGVEHPSDVVLRASFDDEVGYPRRFYRHVMGRSLDIEWEVRRFER